MKSTIHISKSALQGNLRAVQAVVGSGIEVLAVVKANAYGHSATLCAPALAEAGARWFGVSDVAEGAAVRQALGAGTRILVMCGMEPGDTRLMLQHQLTPVVWTAQHVRALQQAAEAADTRCLVHVEIDTGMTRQGCDTGAELADVLRELQQSTRVMCEGVMSHLCCAESHDAEITRQQQSRFLSALTKLGDAGVKPAFMHLANSSGVDESSTLPAITEFAKAHGATALVRTGFALYGHVLPLENIDLHPGTLASNLVPAMTWTTRIIDLRDVPAGTTVGYGATFAAPHPMRLALLPVGYADGFRRAASSGLGDGWVMISGQRAPIVGRVSMNLTVVDVTALDGVGIGDEVILLGDGVSAEEHAHWSSTIAYDIVCGVQGNRVLEA